MVVDTKIPGRVMCRVRSKDNMGRFGFAWARNGSEVKFCNNITINHKKIWTEQRESIDNCATSSKKMWFITI